MQPWQEFILSHLKAQHISDTVAKRTATQGIQPSTSAAKATAWAGFMQWTRKKALSFPINLTSVVNYLGELTTRDDHLVSYGSFRMIKATIVNTLRLTSQVVTSEAEETMLVHLTKTVGRENPDTAKYAGTFNLDDLTSFLLKEYEEKPHSSLDIHSHKSRGVMRRRAITNLKLHLLFRSDDCLQMTRGSLFDVEQVPALGSHWGPMAKTEDGQQCPEWVLVCLTKTKTSGRVEHRIPFCPSEPALCPVLSLLVYIRLYKGLKLASYINQDSSIWLGVTAGKDRGEKRYLPLSTPDPIAKDTLTTMTAAGIDGVYKAHALRSAVASAHIEAGASELDLMAFARWSSTSVFRKFYARMRAKDFSIASIVPHIPSVALTQVAPPHLPLTLTHSSLDAQTKLVPRLNLTGPRGGKKVVPGAEWRDIEGEKVLIHCSSCWEPDDHTMVWCRSCNQNFHAEHLEGSAEEVESNHVEGWFCSDAKCVGS